ncbi:MAG: efflux RND transporter periplasmic adaptor subunit [Phycisphaerae bacterium]|nr:efflux RND transporter periplasmic adaptor subunit [Phycisphaerae bacterium]
MHYGVLWKVVAAVAILSGAYYYFGSGGNSRTRAATVAVQRGTLPIRIKTGGSALSMRSRRVRSEVEGTVKILSIIEEGYRVTRQDIQNKLVLVEFDSKDFKDRIMNYEIEYENALTLYSKAEQDYEVMKKENESIIQAAERLVKFKGMDFQKYVGEDLANELIDELLLRWAAEKALEDIHRAAQALQLSEAEEDDLTQQANEAAVKQVSNSPMPQAALDLISAQDKGKGAKSGSKGKQDKKRTSDSGESNMNESAKQYGLLDEQRSAQQLQEKAAEAREKTRAARDQLTKVTLSSKTAFEKAGLDPNAFTADPLGWTLDFPPWDFLALGQDKRLGGQAELERERLHAEIMLDQEGLLMAKKSLEGSKKLLKNDFLTETDLEGEQLSYDRKQIDLKMKEENEKLFMRYDFPKLAEETFALYEEALRQLDQVQKTNVTRLEAANVDVMSAEKRMLYREEAKKQNEEQIDKYKILAQTEGLVVYQQRDWDEEPIREGLMVREGMTLLTIPDITQMAISANIPESVIKKVKIGQRADIKIEAGPNEIIEGEVFRVGALPSNKSRYMNPDLKLYETTVAIKETYEWLKPGMTAELEIYIEDLENIVFVPMQAVTAHQGKRVCYLASGERRAVETGEFNEMYIEIKSGLNEGDEVLLDLRPFQGEIDDGTDGVEESQASQYEESVTGTAKPSAADTI